MKPSPRNLTSYIWLGVFNSIALLFFASLPSVANAQSTERSNPTPLTSKRLPGNIAARDDTPYFYSFLGGPGKITIKLTMQKQEEYAYLELQALDPQQRSLLTLEGSSIDWENKKTLQLGTQQVIILQLKSVRSSASGSYVLTLDGPVAFTSSLAASGSPGAAQPPATPKDTKPPTITILSPEVTREQVVRVKTCNITLQGRVTDDSPIRDVAVNGAPVSLNQQSEFSTNLTLRSGDNRIIVSATDAYGNTARENYGFVCETASPPPTIAGGSSSSPSYTAGKQYALVIGINEYQILPKLHTAVNDAKEVARVLEEQFGFEVELLLDNGRAEISMALNRYQQKLDENSRLLIYYAGHGEYDKEANKAYWLPADANKNDDVNWIIADDITAKLNRIKAQHVLVISDSCYSGTLSRDADLNLTTPVERQRYLLKAGNGKSRVLIASGGNEPVTDSGGGKHSVFAAALLRGLREMKETEFTAEELFHSYILQQVTGRSDQKPEYSYIRNSGHDGGDFIFIRKK